MTFHEQADTVGSGCCLHRPFESWCPKTSTGEANGKVQVGRPGKAHQKLHNQLQFVSWPLTRAHKPSPPHREGVGSSTHPTHRK